MPIGKFKNFQECVNAQTSKGKSVESAKKICGSLQAKTERRENVKFMFSPSFEIKEGVDNQGKWLRIGGIALQEGVSLNNNKYTVENLKDNDGQDFKWLFGHPSDDTVEEHIVGKGKLSFEGGDLLHEGRIRNTSRHPDVVESIQDGFLGPSIHASAKQVTRTEEGVFEIEGLSVDAVGLVAFQGVKGASIDYALAESFDVIKEDNIEVKKTMEEEQPKEEQPKEEPAPAPEPAPEEKPAESVSVEDFKKVKEELESMKVGNKAKLVEAVLKVNKELKEADLLKESEERLNLRLEYEQKLATKTESVGVVETPEESNDEAKLVLEKDGSVGMAKETYAKFNEDIRSKVR